MYGALRFFARHRLHLDWLNLRYVNGFLAANAAVILAAGWTMLPEARQTLTVGQLDRLARSCALLSIAWAFVMVVAVVPSLRRSAAWQGAATSIALLAFVLSLGGRGDLPAVPPAEAGPRTGGMTAPDPGSPGLVSTPTAAQGTVPAVREMTPGAPTSVAERRLVLLNFDGADLDTILTMQAQGKLPAFARLIAEGSYGRLASIVPCAAPVTRATLVTGMLPHRHGVRAAETRRVFGAGPSIDMVPPGIGFDALLSCCLERRWRSVADRRTPKLL